MKPFRIGTRGSRLALAQAGQVAEQLRPLLGRRPVHLVEVQTSGDQGSELPLSQIGGEGIFTKEIQRQLLAGAVDCAVHSLKDLPTAAVGGLVLAAVPERASARDVFIGRDRRAFEELAAGSSVGTGSLRRRAQVLNRRPDLRVSDIRGNVETRLRKLADGAFDGLVLAAAGIGRLGLDMSDMQPLPLEWMFPAVGQGALGLECRADDGESLGLLGNLDHLPSRLAVIAERALLAGVGGGCLVPLGVSTRVDGTELNLHAVILDSDGRERIEAEISGPIRDPERLGLALARRMSAQGAGRLLQIRSSPGTNFSAREGFGNQ